MVAWMAGCMPCQFGPTSPPMRMPFAVAATVELACAVEQEAPRPHDRLHRRQARSIGLLRGNARIGQPVAVTLAGADRGPLAVDLHVVVSPLQAQHAEQVGEPLPGLSGL